MAVTIVKCRICGKEIPIDLDDCDADDGFAVWATKTRPGFGIRCMGCVLAGRK